jgi:hypothetical protein
MKLTTLELLQKRKYNPATEPQPEQVILKIGDKKVGSLQNIVTISGKQKQGKSRYVGAAIASGLTGEPVFDITLRLPYNRNKIALFDTEQGEFDFYRNIKQVKEMAGIIELPGSFEAFNTREDEPMTQLKMIDTYFEINPDCAVMFIDGLLDLLIDFNDARESKNLINFLKRITKTRNCLIIGVIHRGKGSDTTLGHLGSMADRLAQSVLKIEKIKERNTYCLSAEYLRSDEDFTPIEIYWSSTGWKQTFHIEPKETAKIKSIKLRPEDYPDEDHLIKLPSIFSVSPVQPYETLLQNIKEYYGVGRNWAVECIKHLRDCGLIYKNDIGYTYTKKKISAE